MTWELIESRSSGRGGLGGLNGLCSVGLNHGSKHIDNILRMTVCEEAMKVMRWVIGDKVMCAMDLASKLILIRRDNEKGGLHLSPCRGKIKDSAGKCEQASLQCTIPEHMCAVVPKPSERCKWKPDDAGLIIQLP